MYSVSVSDYIFISHSLDHPNFGPAQNLHGATLNITVSVFSQELNEMSVVVDIGILQESLQSLKKTYHYKNLDNFSEFNGKLTTIEFLCNYFAKMVKDYLQVAGEITENSPLEKIRITIEESPNASASYDLII